MRKIFAYIVTVVTLLALMVFSIPSIKENTNFSMEYTGGFEALYKTKSSMADVNDNTIAQTISDGMNKILDINDVNNAIVTVEDGNYIRANVTSKNQIISDEIKNLIQNSDSYEISFRDAQDNLLATGDEILKEVGATYNGDKNYSGYPIIYLNIKDTVLLHEITSTVSQASDTHLVIWVGFEEGVDSYSSIETNSSTAKKVIYNATVSEALSDEVITVTGQYTEEAAKNTVNLINSGTYDYEMELVQIKSVKEADALRTRTLTLIGIAVAILVPLMAMVIRFKMQGLTSVITVIASELATILMFNKIAGVINPHTIAAFILFNVALFTLMYLLLSKYNSMSQNNKSTIKAYRETFKKNGSIILDTCATILLFSLVTYFLGNNAHHFAILLSVSSVSLFISLYIFERFTMYLTCDYKNKSDKILIVAASTTSEEVSSISTDVKEYTKPVLYGFLGLLSLGLIVILITTLAFKKPFSYHGDARNIATLEIVATEEYFTTEEEVREFFNQEDIAIELESIKLESLDNKYHITVTSKEDIAKYEEAIKNELVVIYGENTDYEEYYVVYLNDYSSESLAIAFKSTLYTSGMALVVIAIYFALRYRYSYSLATITAVAMVAASLVAFFGLTRIPLNNATILGISVATAYALFMLVPLFTKVKEYMEDTKKPYLSKEERIDCFNQGINTMMPAMIVSTLVLSVMSLVIMFFNLANFSMYLSFIFGSCWALVYTLIFIPKIWLLFENERDKRKKTFKNKNISKSKYRKLDEQVFIGVND